MAAFFPVSSTADLRDVIWGQDVTWQFPIFPGVPVELSHVAMGMERRSRKGLALPLPELVVLCVAAFECLAFDESCQTHELSWRPHGASQAVNTSTQPISACFWKKYNRQSRVKGSYTVPNLQSRRYEAPKVCLRREISTAVRFSVEMLPAHWQAVSVSRWTDGFCFAVTHGCYRVGKSSEGRALGVSVLCSFVLLLGPKHYRIALWLLADVHSVIF